MQDKRADTKGLIFINNEVGILILSLQLPPQEFPSPERTLKRVSLGLNKLIQDHWSTGEGNGKPLQYSCLENPMNSMRRQNDRILKEELPRSVGAQYAAGDQWRNNSRKNKGMNPRQKQHLVVDGTGDRSKVRGCKEQYCIGSWNVSSMNQGKLEVVKQEMARVNVNILGISKLKWTGMGEFNSDDHQYLLQLARIL